MVDRHASGARDSSVYILMRRMRLCRVERRARRTGFKRSERGWSNARGLRFGCFEAGSLRTRGHSGLCGSHVLQAHSIDTGVS